MTQFQSQPHLFAEITAKPGMGALFVRYVGPSIGARETPILQTMVGEAIDGFGPSLKHVVLDLAAVSFMNSSGLGMLVDGRTRAARVSNAKVILLNPSADLLDLLKMVKFQKLFLIALSAEELSAAMGR